jgi:hypothetical protein
MEVVRLENEVVIFGIVFGIVQGRSYDKNCFWNCHSTRNEYVHERGYSYYLVILVKMFVCFLAIQCGKKGPKHGKGAYPFIWNHYSYY